LSFYFLFLYQRSILRFVKGHLERDEKDSDKLALHLSPNLFDLKKNIDKKKINFMKKMDSSKITCLIFKYKK
jgi:hypothetical protein